MGSARHGALRLIKAAEAAIPFLEKELSSQFGDQDNGWILEGERVHPKLTAQFMETAMVHEVFIVETDAQCLDDTLMVRLPGFIEISEARRRTVAQVDQLYNVWRIEESRKQNVPCVTAQPWASLAERILEVCSVTR